MKASIPFNKPFIAGKELHYIAQAVTLGNLAGDGEFTQKCAGLLEERFGIHKTLMTPSCTAALEMALMLCDLQPGDEVILPSFNFVSSANAVVLQGGTPVFVDIRPDTLNLDENLIGQAITEKTKVIIPVHYAGVACEMDRISEIAKQHNLLVVEDAAQGVNAFYKECALGSMGDLGAYSFHETKNYICGEGGALCINSPELVERAEVIRDKGTNRQKFFRGEVDKYTWVDVGSSYVPSEIACAFLYGQLEMLDEISKRRHAIYRLYDQRLKPLEAEGLLELPRTPKTCRHNSHMYYVVLQDTATRDGLIAHLWENEIKAVFHYVPLHSSPMGQRFGKTPQGLPFTEDISSRLLRLPLFYDITQGEQTRVVDSVTNFLTNR